LSFLRARWRPGHPRELGILAGTLGIFEEVLSRAADTLREMDPRDERSWSWRGAWTHSRSRRPVAGWAHARRVLRARGRRRSGAGGRAWTLWVPWARTGIRPPLLAAPAAVAW